MGESVTVPPTPACPEEPDDLSAVNINLGLDLDIIANLNLCVDTYLDLSLDLLPKISIPGIPNFKIDLGLLLPDPEDLFDLLNDQECLHSGVGSPSRPLPIFSTRNRRRPIAVPTEAPTTDPPLNSLSSVIHTPPPPPPDDTTTTSTTVAPVVILTPTIVISPDDPCFNDPNKGDPPCNFLNF